MRNGVPQTGAPRLGVLNLRDDQQLAETLPASSLATHVGDPFAEAPLPAGFILDTGEVARVAAVVVETLRQAGLLPTMPAAVSNGAGELQRDALPAFVSMRVIAERIGISEATAWRWHSSGKLGPAGDRRGGKRLFARDEFESWLAAGMPGRE